MTISKTTPSEPIGQSPIKEWKLIEGAVLRYCILMTHYRQPLNFSEARMQEAKRTLERLVKGCKPSHFHCFPPLEFLESFCDDNNTPKAIYFLHKYRKEGRGIELFACMKYLGFFEGEQGDPEIKTLPLEYKADPGPSTIGGVQ